MPGCSDEGSAGNGAEHGGGDQRIFVRRGAGNGLRRGVRIFARSGVFAEAVPMAGSRTGRGVFFSVRRGRIFVFSGDAGRRGAMVPTVWIFCRRGGVLRYRREVDVGSFVSIFPVDGAVGGKIAEENFERGKTVLEFFDKGAKKSKKSLIFLRNPLQVVGEVLYNR